MTVDNIESIRGTLEFDKFGEFYYISIMQRNKDGVKVASSHDNCRRIRTFYVFSLEEFDRVVPFIKEICSKINARCYIEINRKDIFQCQLECIERLAECIVSVNQYPKEFQSILRKLAAIIYPLLPAMKTKNKPQNGYQYSNGFSNNVNNTLNNMRKKY